MKLLTDNPLLDKKLDGLGYKKYSEILSKAIVSTDTPFTVGIFGEWGKGKTTLLKFIQDEIAENKKENKCITVFFNAWQYENDENPIVPLLVAIQQEIEKNKSIYEKAWQGFSEGYSKIDSALKASIYALSAVKFKSSLFGMNSDSIEVDVSPKEWLERFEQNLEEREGTLNKLINQSTYFQVFDILKKLSENLNDKFKIVVFIDDLDRCLPNNAIKLLESIKLILNEKGFTFVLAVAREVIEGHLEHRYKKEFGIRKGNHGKFYLDKIIQLPFYLPNNSSRTKELSHSLYKKVNDTDKLEEEITNVLEVIGELDIVTPRFLVRLINRIKISSQIQSEDDKDITTWLAIFSVASSLEELFKEDYKYIATSDSKIEYLEHLIENKDDKKALENFEISMGEEEKNNLKSISSNTVIKNILISDSGKIWRTEKVKRLEAFELLKATSEKKDYEKIDIHDDLIKRAKEAKKKVLDKKIDVSLYINNFIEIEGQDYEFSKYLVTNAWYEEFIKDDGYKDDKFWESKEAKKFRKENEYNFLDDLYSQMILDKALKEWYKVNTEKDLKKEYFNNPLQPIVYISYYEAKAFCEWLSEKSKKSNDSIKYKYSIPSQEQFEYVALKERATKVKEDREKGEYKLFPWGNEFNQNYCNNGFLKLGSTSVVGIFPDGDSSFAVSDMSGNVWKWTSSKDNDGDIFLKGGSWNYDREDVFSASRSIAFIPDFRDYGIGFFLTRTKVIP